MGCGSKTKKREKSDSSSDTAQKQFKNSRKLSCSRYPRQYSNEFKKQFQIWKSQKDVLGKKFEKEQEIGNKKLPQAPQGK